MTLAENLVATPVVGVGVANDHTSHRPTRQTFCRHVQILGCQRRLEGVQDQRLVAQIDDAGVAIGRPAKGSERFR